MVQHAELTPTDGNCGRHIDNDGLGKVHGFDSSELSRNDLQNFDS